jgi:hypothetical protein
VCRVNNDAPCGTLFFFQTLHRVLIPRTVAIVIVAVPCLGRAQSKASVKRQELIASGRARASQTHLTRVRLHSVAGARMEVTLTVARNSTLFVCRGAEAFGVRV